MKAKNRPKKRRLFLSTQPLLPFHHSFSPLSWMTLGPTSSRWIILLPVQSLIISDLSSSGIGSKHQQAVDFIHPKDIAETGIRLPLSAFPPGHHFTV